VTLQVSGEAAWATLQVSCEGGMGDPSSTQRGGSNETWTYSYHQTNIGAKAFIPFANLVGESAVDVKASLLMIRFNEKGIVENVMSRIAGDK